MGEVLAGRRRWIWVAVAVVVLALIAYGVVHALTADASEKPKAAPTVAADRGAVSTDVGTTGTVEPAQTRSLSFTVDGTVDSVSVRPGSQVQAGQTLAKVDDSDARQAVDDAQTALDEADQQLTDARTSSAEQTRAAASGTSTGCAAPAAYTVPTSSSPSPGASAGGHPTASPTRTSTPTRTGSPTPTTSHGTGTGSGTGAGPGSGTGTGTRGGSTGGTAAGACGRTGTSGAAGSGSSGNQGQGSGSDAVLSAQQRVVSANTTLENAEDALEGATITAPIAGRILAVSGKVGSQVSAGSTFITLAGTSNMQIDADFPEADADNLKVGQTASVTLADQEGKTFKATVVEVDPTGTSDGTMVRYGVQLAFAGAGEPQNLLVGQSATVAVTTGSKADVLRVPTSAVHDVAGATGTVLEGGARVKVGIGLRGDQYTEITSGLAEGDEVVRSW